MSKKEILSKAFEIMIRNYEDGKDLCNEIGLCIECPFNVWEVCPNCSSREYEENEED